MAGPIVMEGPGSHAGAACAEPSCGELPNDPSGSSRYTSHASEQQRNKQNKAKAQKKPAAQKAIKNTNHGQTDLYTSVIDWVKGLSYTSTSDGETESPSGKVLTGPSCKYLGPAEHNPCIERKADVEQVFMPNGTVENQLLFTVILYEKCYYESKCGPDYYSFIASSESELKRLFNEAIGENYF